jgi:hypothetical protein
VANLSTPLAGDAPHLDSLLVSLASRRQGKVDVEEGYKINRLYPCPDSNLVRIPILRTRIGSYNVARCTSPILGSVTNDRHEYIAKRIGVEYSGLVSNGERRVVTTTNSWTKSYRLPLRVRNVDRIAWLCVGTRREILNVLDNVCAVGKKTAHGYGRVAKWECESWGDETHDRWPWWIDGETGPVLMRPIPFIEGLPAFVGAKRDYGACSDPYWHPDKYGEIVVPC